MIRASSRHRAAATALRLARRFFLGRDDGFRRARLKLIPRVVEGPWVVRQAAGGKPAPASLDDLDADLDAYRASAE